ncbi:MAG: pilus assembly protein TadG-related protein [Terriglobales bacterium]
MRLKKNISGRKSEQGIIITLVAVFILCVIGAMAALSIDVVTLYTARSEAQLAADSAALAAARVLANSGITSEAGGGLVAAADTLAQGVALQVAGQNQVGGSSLTAVSVVFGGTDTNPTVTVSVQKTDLPTFFARIWGTKFVTVGASATAEAYNPSPNAGGTSTGGPPVAPICVKPWLLPNLDPSNTGSTTAPIFDPTSGAIQTTTLLGWSSTDPSGVPMTLACASANGTCTVPLTPSTTLQPWSYFPGDDGTTFPHPINSQPSCNPALTTNYQESVAGCIEIPISCSSPAKKPANIDTQPYPNPSRNSDTADAVNCLTHATAGKGDTVASKAPPVAPFQFVAGADNPITGTASKDVMVSDSLVTVPVFDVTNYSPNVPSVPIIGFVQLFLNPDGNATLPSGAVNTTVINLVGCGTSATGTPILGNGASPVAVRLISP